MTLPLVTFQNAAAATGNGSSHRVEDFAGFLVQISGTFVGTVIFEASMTHASPTWTAVQAVNMVTGDKATSATATGLYYIPMSGLDELRTRVSAYTSGAITAKGRRTNAPVQLQDVQIETADIEVGAVEIKNASTDDRATVDASGNLQVKLGTSVPAGTNKIGGVDLDSDATVGAAVPAVGQAVAGTDGTNARLLKTDANGELQVDVLTMPTTTVSLGDDADLDSGGGTDNHEVVAIGVAASGGHAVITGDVANGLDVDVTRVSGTVTVDSELPAAAALADATANPTVPATGDMLHVFNGTTWDRARGDIANGLDVDVTRLPSGTVAGSASLPAGTNNIGDVDVLTVPAPLSTSGGGTEATALRVTLASDSTGLVSVDDNGGSITVDVGTALPAGTNNIGDVDVASVPTSVVSPSNQASTDAYADVTGATVDTSTTGATFVAFLLKEVGGANGITYRLQGSIDGTTYTTIVGPLDATGTEDADGEVAVAANGSQEWFITPQYDSGAKAAYRHYKVQVKATVAASQGTAQVRIFAK